MISPNQNLNQSFILNDLVLPSYDDSLMASEESEKSLFALEKILKILEKKIKIDEETDIREII